MSVDESQLIKRVIAYDDQFAFKTLVRNHQSALRLFLRRILGQDELADEIAQEAFWIAYRKLDQLQKNNFRSWLYTIAYRLALKELRKRRPTEEIDAEKVEDQSRQGIADLQFDLSKALSDLPEEDRQILLDWAKDGASHQDLSERYGMPLGTIKSVIMRAKNKLKRKLSHYGGNEL